MLHRAGVEVLPDGRIEYDVAEIVGPYTWGLLHHAVETFPCEHCREEGARLLHGLHDVVNADLGKPIKFPEDLKFLASHVDKAIALLPKKSPAGNLSGAIEADIERLARSVGFLSAKLAAEPCSGNECAAPELSAAGQGLGQVLELEQLNQEIGSLRDTINRSPAAPLVKFVKRSGDFKGELVDFTKGQYRDLVGKDPLPTIVKNGRVPWELAIDVIASELGFRDDEDLKRAAERLVADLRRVDQLELQKQRLVQEHPACDRIVNELIACDEFPDRDCRQKSLPCAGGVDMVAVRHPSNWTVHRVEDNDVGPDDHNQVAQVRLAGEANRTMKLIGQFPDDPDILSNGVGSDRCGTAKAAQWERCVQEVKAEGSADSPFAVCTASVGCSPS